MSDARAPNYFSVASLAARIAAFAFLPRFILLTRRFVDNALYAAFLKTTAFPTRSRRK